MSMTLRSNVLSKYRNPFFVETGTWQGDGVALALQVGFPNVRSIELSKKDFDDSCRRFAGDSRVKLYFGDSSKMLYEVIANISGQITFWLDAHEFYGVKGDKDCPLIEELQQIARHPFKDHTILIDDRRVFKQWQIDEQEVIRNILAINPEYKISFEANSQRPDDVLVATLP